MQILEFQLQNEYFQYNNLFQEIKIQFLLNDELEYISTDFESKRISSKEAFVDCLQNICDTIDQKILRIEANVEANYISVYEFDILQDECKKLKWKLNLFESELIELGCDLRNYEAVDFYKGILGTKKPSVPNPNIAQLTIIQELLKSLTPVREQNKEQEQIIQNSNLYSHIFVDGSFSIWDAMFNDFEIKESSRTDVKFMFDKMKKDGLIFKTIKEVDFLDWVNTTYQIAVQKISYADLNNPKRNAIYNNAKSSSQKKI